MQKKRSDYAAGLEAAIRNNEPDTVKRMKADLSAMDAALEKVAKEALSRKLA